MTGIPTSRHRAFRSFSRSNTNISTTRIRRRVRLRWRSTFGVGCSIPAISVAGVPVGLLVYPRVNALHAVRRDRGARPGARSAGHRRSGAAKSEWHLERTGHDPAQQFVAGVMDLHSNVSVPADVRPGASRCCRGSRCCPSGRNGPSTERFGRRQTVRYRRFRPGRFRRRSAAGRCGRRAARRMNCPRFRRPGYPPWPMPWLQTTPGNPYIQVQPRIMPLVTADRIFRSTDDLVFNPIVQANPLSDRPTLSFAYDAATGNIRLEPSYQGSYSWFATIAPASSQVDATAADMVDTVTQPDPSALYNTRQFNVSVVVCQNRRDRHAHAAAGPTTCCRANGRCRPRSTPAVSAVARSGFTPRKLR